MTTVTLADILHAQNRIRPYVQPTPLEPAFGLGPQVWLKLENVNLTHSFKIRGALNAILALDAGARARGIVAASSGNHAQAVAYAASLVGAQASIVMPEHTPKRKVEGTRRFGAEAILFGENYDAAEAHARHLETARGHTFVSAYNDPHVIAGAGTCGLEIIQANPEIQRVIVPTSGGGLIAGVAAAVRGLKPDVEIIGVNAEHAPAMYNAFYGTHMPQINETLAEALSGEIEGTLTIDLSKQYVDRIELVSEQQIADAMRWMLFEQGWVVEGGGVVGVAAMLGGVIPAEQQPAEAAPADTCPTAIVISGSNVDAGTLVSVL